MKEPVFYKDPFFYLGILITCFVIGAYNEARAADVTLNWQNATQNEDGSTIPATGDNALDTTTIEYAACIGGQLSAPRTQAIVPATEQTTILSIITPGDWCFVAFHTNVAGNDSAESNIAIKTIIPATPNPPGLLTVTDLVVFTVAKTTDRFLLVAVGTVPSGTTCDPDQSVNGHYAVPINQVTWSGTVRPVVVVAKCG
jgi:hypothetical protein